jgi:hypothetical protein
LLFYKKNSFFKIFHFLLLNFFFNNFFFFNQSSQLNHFLNFYYKSFKITDNTNNKENHKWFFSNTITSHFWKKNKHDITFSNINRFKPYLLINNKYADKNFQPSEVISLKNNPFFKNDKKINFLYLQKLAFFFNAHSFANENKLTHQANRFFLAYRKTHLYIANLKKFEIRWKTTNDLLTNLFHYNINPLIFSNSIHKTLTLPLNWFFHKWDTNLWKFCFSFFIYRLKKNSTKIDLFYKKLKKYHYSVFFLSDPLYHYKNIPYFHKYGYYTIGLTSMSTNPWLVSFPIVIFLNNFLIQSFFLKFLNYSKNQSNFYRFLTFKKIWSIFLINSKIKNF